MKKLMIIWLLLFYSGAFASAPVIDINEVRVLYQRAEKDEKSCTQMVGLLSQYDVKDPLLLGYRAIGTMMMAKYTINPISKWSYFKKGKQLLEKAIDTDPNNVELRFLRFAAQTNIPAFLGYKEHIKSDKAFILNSIPGITEIKLKELVFPFLISSKYLNTNEKRSLK